MFGRSCGTLSTTRVKFTARGQVSLTAEFNQTATPKLKFQITDTGIGISVTEQQRIFDMYYKSSDGRRLSIVGSGIGLSVSKALVDAMHGNISVSSQINQGPPLPIELPTEVLLETRRDTSSLCAQV
ncbi:MAG: ATP-binding protein [Rheinheimera sp.]|nr:ATP-binding protein [Rheinheimera sp.]